MEAKREQALVGLFVLIAAALLLITLFALSGAFTTAGDTYKAYFKFAGGIEPGKAVRYAGGVKVGRVEAVRVDPQDPSRIEVTFSVLHGTPIRKDTTARIFSLSALGENYMELRPGKKDSPVAPPGSVLPSVEYTSFNDLGDMLADLGPGAKQLLAQLNDRATELKETIARVNDLINEQNRANISASLSNVRGMLEEDRPKVKSTLTNIDATSAKLPAMIDDFKKTVADADKALKNIDDVIGENRKDLREAVKQLREALTSANSMVSQLDRTVGYNAENIDELIENMRHTAENLKQFTDTIKTRPYTLIRSSNPKEHKPGTPPQQ